MKSTAEIQLQILYLQVGHMLQIKMVAMYRFSIIYVCDNENQSTTH